MPVFLLALLASCGSPGFSVGPAQPPLAPTAAPAPPVPADLLAPRDRALRVSAAIRGIRPTQAELASVEADPSALSGLVDQWLESPEFLATIRDLHAEQLQVRTDAYDVTLLPARGPFDGQPIDQLIASIDEEPLVLVEHVVAENHPYTEIVTADYMLTDQTLATAYGLPYDPAGPDWQISHWTDGRPEAGLLSSSQLFRRHQSAGSNFHRGRANFVSTALLCEDFSERDVIVEGGIDLSDEAVVADAVQNNPACIGCHQGLDPLASLFWGYRPLLQFKAVNIAYDMGCEMSPFEEEPPQAQVSPIEDACYPLRHYTPANEDMWADWDLRPPGYFGTPVSRLDALGALIADDPRFSECTVRRFWSWFAQTDEDALPAERVAELQAGFESSGYDAKNLVKTLVLSDDFLARTDAGVAGRIVVPLLPLRPEAYARNIEDLTGFTWRADPKEVACDPQCWDDVDLARSDLFGFRAMAGGTDGFLVLEPTPSATPTRVMTWSRFAAEAAGFAVDADLAQPDPSLRRLLGAVSVADAPSTVRDELAALHSRVLDEVASTDDLDEEQALFDLAFGDGNLADAWKLVLATLLQDPRLVWY